MRELHIGIDVGGTFTDAVVLDVAGKRCLTAFKLPSTPSNPEQAVVAAVRKIAEAVDVTDAVVFHGTTVGTNTLIERKGAKTALLTTKGFADVIELRRQARPNLYSFHIKISEPLVAHTRRFEVSERIAADGQIIAKLDAESAIERLKSTAPESIAVSLLHCYANSAHEEELVSQLHLAFPDAYITRSSDVCPEFREYERTSTTIVNAYVGPAVAGYLSKLEDELRSRGIQRLMIVKSSGGLTSPQNAVRYPVHLIESGPAAQLIAAAAFARATGRKQLVAFDMGGTTAKAGLIRDGRPEVTSEFYADRLVEGVDVGGYAIRSSVLDLVEIGAGGGSIAWIDDANVLKVGPQSAGALPGPACYARGGDRPTVTDAHAVIGTVTPELLHGSGVEVRRELAVEAITRHIADPFGWSVAQAAYSIIDIAVANMAEMIRLATTRRGVDPRLFPILASGGAGPLHAAAVADQIGATEVVIPHFPGMFSALGATLGAVRHEAVQTVLRNLRDLNVDSLTNAFATLSDRLRALLAVEPQGIGGVMLNRILEARFVGQLFELPIALGRDGERFPSRSEIEKVFRSRYTDEYGFDLPDAQVEVVNLRLVSEVNLRHHDLPVFAAEHLTQTHADGPPRSIDLLQRNGKVRTVPVYGSARDSGSVVDGPAIIEQAGATVWIHEGHTATIGSAGGVTVRLVEDP